MTPTSSSAAPSAHPERRERVAGVVLMAICVLACTAPVIGGVLAGSFLDRVLDSPAWIAVVVGLGVAAVVGLRRRNRGCADGC